jgi:hypothetical protein
MNWNQFIAKCKLKRKKSNETKDWRQYMSSKRISEMSVVGVLDEDNDFS